MHEMQRRADPKGHNKNNCPDYGPHVQDTICTRFAKKLVLIKSGAQRDRVLHVIIERTSPSLRRTLSVLNTYAQRAAKRVTIARTVQLLNVKHAVFGGACRTIAR